MARATCTRAQLYARHRKALVEFYKCAEFGGSSSTFSEIRGSLLKCALYVPGTCNMHPCTLIYTLHTIVNTRRVYKCTECGGSSSTFLPINKRIPSQLRFARAWHVQHVPQHNYMHTIVKHSSSSINAPSLVRIAQLFQKQEDPF